MADCDDFDPTDPAWRVFQAPISELTDEEKEQRRLIESLFLYGYERTHFNECLNIS